MSWRSRWSLVALRASWLSARHCVRRAPTVGVTVGTGFRLNAEEGGLAELLRGHCEYAIKGGTHIRLIFFGAVHRAVGVVAIEADAAFGCLHGHLLVHIYYTFQKISQQSLPLIRFVAYGRSGCRKSSRRVHSCA